MRSVLGVMMLTLPLLANAAAEGAWQASGMGITLHNRGVSASSSVLSPPPSAYGLMTIVSWSYTPIGPTPANLLVRLCSQSRCVELDGESGSTRAFTGVPAIEPMHFVWDVPGGGRMYPPLKILSNRVIVNYK